MGYSDIPINKGPYDVASTIRNVQLLKLGSSPLAGVFGDILTGTIQARRVSGRPDNVLEVVNTIIGRFDWRDKELIKDLGIMSEEFLHMQNRFTSPDSLDESRSYVSGYVSTFMRLSGLELATKNSRQASQMHHMRAIAKVSNLGYKDLHQDIQFDLNAAGIDSARWDLLRKNVFTTKDGRKYLLPKNTRDLKSKDFEQFLPEELSACLLYTSDAAEE